MTRKILLTIMFLGVALTTQAQRKLLEGIVVRVNDRIVTTVEVLQRLAEREGETGRPMPSGDFPAFVKEVADELCLLERAAELKLEVGADELDAAVKSVRERSRASDDATFEKSLRDMGITLEQLKNRLRDNILVDRLLYKEVGALPITEEEIRARYEKEKGKYRIPDQVKMEHIVLPTSTDNSDGERIMASARRLVAASRAQGSFLSLVQKEVEAGHGFGGDLGVVAIPDLKPEVKSAIEKLKPGEISDPFSSAAGVHVVRLVDRVPASFKPFQEVADELRQSELAERYRGHLSRVVSELKTRYIVETHPELLTTAP